MGHCLISAPPSLPPSLPPSPQFVDRFWELDLYQKEDGNFVPYILNNQDGTPEIEAGASSFAPYPRREEDFFFYRKSTPLENVRTMKVRLPSFPPFFPSSLPPARPSSVSARRKDSSVLGENTPLDDAPPTTIPSLPFLPSLPPSLPP